MNAYKAPRGRRLPSQTNVVCILADELPEKFNPQYFQLTTEPEPTDGLHFLWRQTIDGKTAEIYGYL